jgi:hypothetical protein
MKMKWVTDIYLSVFVLFFRIGRNSWSYTSNAAKAVAGITWIQLMLLVGVIAWLYYFTGVKLLLAIPRPVFYISFGIITLVNYYTLVTRQVGTLFESEFSNFAYRRRSLLIATSIAVVIGSLGFALLSANYVHTYGPLHP